MICKSHFLPSCFVYAHFSQISQSVTMINPTELINVKIAVKVDVKIFWCEEYANAHNPTENAAADMIREINGISFIQNETHEGV